MSDGIVGTPVESCKQCRFHCGGDYEEIVRYVDHGGSLLEQHITRSDFVCRRFPRYELRRPAEWCGEFKAKDG